MNFLLFVWPIILFIVSLPFLIWFLPKKYGGLTTAKILGVIFLVSLLIGFFNTDFLRFFFLAILVAIIGLPLLIWMLPKRYGRLTTAKIIGGAFILSLLIGSIGLFIIKIEIGKAYEGNQWNYYKSIEGSNMSFEYRPDVGVYAINNKGDETQITNKWPFCAVTDQATGGEPVGVYHSTNLNNLLPFPPRKEQARISFILTYPTEEKHSVYTSFVLFENGEVWCAERYFTGMADPGDMSVGNSLGMIALLLTDIEVCVDGFILILIIIIGVIEIRRRKVEKLPARGPSSEQ